MGLRRVALAVAVAAAFGASHAAFAQDFDPHGRHRSRPPSRPAAGGHGAPRPAESEGASPSEAGGPTQTALIERYTRVALAQPGVLFPLQRLAQLYRQRDGTVARLVTDLEARAGSSSAEAYGALVALAGVQKLDGRIDNAIATYEKAIALRASDPAALLSLAHLHEERGDVPLARAGYEQALALQSARADKEQTLRTLMALALSAQDWPAAQRFHRELVTLEPTSLFVRGELGRELYSRGEYARAAVELKDAVAAASGDNRALAPALKELGRAQAKAHDPEAIATLDRALSAAGEQAALRAEIYATIAEIYRHEQRLPALVKQLEDERPSDAARLALLGGLYEETGDSAKAIATYRRALRISPRQVEMHVRMIRLLQANGDLDQAIAEYGSLIRSAPDNPQFVFEQCEALMQRGDHPRALKLVSDLEARAGNDEEVLSRVADFYARIGEGERSLRVLQRLANSSGGSDPGHWVDLGDRYFQDGNAKLAVQTWKRILTAVSPRARALTALGDVYLEHDMASDGIAAYREALGLDPENLGTKKALAAALERNHAYREATALYEEIVAKAKTTGDRPLARECRTRIVTLWGLEHVLEQELPGLRQQFAAAPPDVEAGRMLAEAFAHLRRLPEAESVLRRVIDLAPGDVDSHLALERVLVQQNRVADAIAVLEKVAELEPKRARELYERMAQYALQIYHDDDAIRFAARAVELNPDDAEGHRALGEMYRSKQDTGHAIAEFRAAIAKNDRLFLVYFELADLLLTKGQADEADRLFRSVVRGAPDEELVARAARLSMQINLGRGTLESLEQDLLPLAIGNPQRPIYRRLLVEIYGGLTFGLVQRVRHGGPDESREAREALVRIGARAVKPLLDALADADLSQQRVAIDVLAYVQNRNAALPLFSFATGQADMALRTRAMLACGALSDGSLVPKYEALLFPKDRPGEPALADPVAVAAVWGLSKIADPRALPVLRRVAAGGAPGARALAVLGLGRAGDTASIDAIAAIARSADSGPAAQAAAVVSLGELNAQGQVPMLLEIAHDGETLPRRMALVALARMAASMPKEPSWKGEAVAVAADAVFAEADEVALRASEAIARTAVHALVILARGKPASFGAATPEPPAPDGALDVEMLLGEMIAGEDSDADRAAAFLAFAEPIQRAATTALQTSGARSSAVLDALGSGEGEFLPFVTRDTAGPAAQKARALAAALEPGLVALAHHPDPAIRTKALRLVARSSTEAAAAAIVAGLDDPVEAVARVALAAVGDARESQGANDGAARAVAAILARNGNWAMRVLAAGALARLGRQGASGASSGLAISAATDPYALVRQAALEALATFDASAAQEVAERVATTDPEPRVRDAARRVLQARPSPP